MNTPSQVPERIGKYIVKKMLGKGGMGKVYHAYDPFIGRDVALKVMLAELAEDPHLKERFTREAQSAGRLRHPHIVTIYDLGEDHGIPYIAMEYLEGIDLDQYIRRRMPLSLEEKLEIIREAAEALAYAHENGIVHRDIKPANIRLLDNKTVKIMDFGIAKMGATQFTQTGIIMGTPHYMAPEQIRDQRDKIDGRADIFALGVVLYELLCGKRPFEGEQYTTVFYKIVHEAPPPLVDLDTEDREDLQDVLNMALAKNPDERYQSARDFANDLQTILHRIRASLIQQETKVTSVVEEIPTVVQPPPTGIRSEAARTRSALTRKTVSSESTSASTRQKTLHTSPLASEAVPPTPAAISTPTPSVPSLSIAQEELRRPSHWALIGIGSAAIVMISIITLALWLWKKPSSPESTVPEISSQKTNPSHSDQNTPNESNPPAKRTSDSTPSTSTPEGEFGRRSVPVVTPKETEPGFLQISAFPWASVESIKNIHTGKEMEFQRPLYTPAFLSLPPGDYTIVLSHPKAPSSQTRTFTIVSRQTQQVSVVFSHLAWPLENALKSRRRLP